MTPKKNPKKDVFRNSGIFFNVGLIVSLLLAITAFEWKSYDAVELVQLGQVDNNLEELLDIPLTQQPPPPPPKIQQPEIIEVPEEEVIEEIEVDLDIEITEEEVIEEIVFEEAEEEVADEIFTVVEEMAEFKGGNAAFAKFLQKNVVYPSQARRMGVEGKVYVQFVVGIDGTLSDIKILKGLGAGCDEESIRVMKKSPPWKVGKQRGRPVRLRMVIPLNFTLGA
ncbi:MAG: energy transducer TonB [Cyclobacteriaceae bacterium]|nr:energy transducer TonB [Cyclobacteriaceae bacterium]